ncbi:hypothetical protein V4V55_000493 [Vibrio mimicus]
MQHYDFCSRLLFGCPQSRVHEWKTSFMSAGCAQLYRCCAVLANDTTTLVPLFEQ